MERAAKAEQVTELKGVFKTANTVVVAHYAGLTVAQMQILRKQARQAGTTVKVAKNRLAKIALEGTDVASIGSLLKGPTVIAYSSDPVGASKVAVDFAKAPREVRDPGRRDGQDRARSERRQGARRPCRRSTSSGPRSSA